MNLVFRKQLALGLVSAALLANQIVLMQLLATSQWHHFAYLVISVALLGFGAAGSLLSISRDWLLQRQALLLPLLFCGCSLTMVAPLGIAQTLFGGFDSYLMFVSITEALKLAGVAFLLTLPFGLGALAIGMVFAAETEQIGSYYAANLLGSGLGCLLGLLGLEQLPPELLPAFCSQLSLAAAVLVVGKRQITVIFVILLGLLVTGDALWHPPTLRLSQYKDLQRTLTLPEARIIASAPSAAGQIHLVDAPSMRYAPAGVSLNWRGTLPQRPMVFINGNLVGTVPPQEDSHDLLSATTSALPYSMTTPERVMVLAAGTAESVHQALLEHVDAVTASEADGKLTEILRENDQAFDHLLRDPRLSWHSVAARPWLAQDRQTYDLIVLPPVGSFGGDTGLFALYEQPLLTREALSIALEHLASGGFLAVTTWVDYPVKNPLRLLATLLAALSDIGVTEPSQQIAAVRSWGTITFCVKRSPLTTTERTAVLRFADRWGFDTLLLPDLASEKRQIHHRLEDDSLLELIDILFTKQAKSLIKTYPFRIDPPTDDRPYFSQFLLWGHVDKLLHLYGSRTVPFIEVGLLVAVIATLILTMLSIFLILTPLLYLPRQTGRRWQTLLYFGGLGLGYIWVEMTLVHYFTLHLNHPVPAAALVISVLLIGSGYGSVLSSRFNPSNLGRWALYVATGIASYALLLKPVLDFGQTLPLMIRMLLTCILIMPLAILMGIPFPLGLRRLGTDTPMAVPWAWGINGCLSVVGASLATLVAVEVGFRVLLLLAAAAYLLPATTRLVTEGNCAMYDKSCQ